MDADKCKSPITSAATSLLPDAALLLYDRAMTTKEIALKTIPHDKVRNESADFAD
jgi:hypothetical protein